ncbi:lipopolysaccharide biosynthesis protein [Collinsella ihumii]|uniref:Oligosaccharide flippase family protein n=1 Tax=Collinsella ihumii TaxID=1720204 RepID=A0AAW7JVJ2_9ACTN|nr:oligosaccharide flippase family protein [Collinsella ihumii]MDN0069803.1 oligosaccharide flippase family protein [Collinsella ihumii]
MVLVPSQRRAGVVLGYANIIVKNLVNLVYTPMLLSFVGQADYGVYQTSSSFVFSLSLLSFGFSQAYVRFYTQKRARGEDARGLNGVYLVLYAVASLAAFLLGLAFAASAGSLFSASFTPEEVELAAVVMSIMAGSIAVTLFNSVFDAYVLAHEEFRFQQSRQMLTTLATPFCAYALLCLGLGVIGVAIAQLAVNLVLLTLNASFCLGKLEMRFEVRRFDTTLFKAIAVFSAWIFANQACDLVYQNVPNVVLGMFTSASTVAVFAVSVQIRNVFYSLSTTISNVFTPEINRIVAETDDNEQLTRLMSRVGRLQMVLFCWVFGGFIILGRFFIEHWAGTGFSDSYWIVLIMVAPLVIPLTQNTGIEIQRAKNMHRARSIGMLIVAAFNVACTFLLSPFIGYWAPAAAYGIGILLCNGAFLNWYYRCRVGLRMGYFWCRCLPVMAAGLVAVASCLAGSSAIPVTSWLAFLAWGLAFTFIFGVALWLLALDEGERTLLSSKLRRRFLR